MLQKLFLVFIYSLLSVSSEDNFIEWSPSRKLSWSDFQGAPDPSSSNAALTHSGINVEFGYNRSTLTHAIKCRFNKSLSWGRIKNDYILNHEQGHFDISEGYARMLHKSLKEYVFNSKTVSSDLNKIHSNVMQQHVKMQQQYDLQTNHSLNAEKQKEWNIKIDSLLRAYEAYSNYR